jgi:hypothetical protein
VKLRNVTLLISILAVAGFVTGAVAQKSAEEGIRDDLSQAKRPEDEATVIRHRSAWFYQQRAYPLPRIPAFARRRAWNDFRQMQRRQRQVYGEKYGPSPSTTALSPSILAAVSSWVPIGPQPTSDYFSQPVVSGRVTAMEVDPCDTTGNTVFLGGALGGLWKTTDGGTHWAVVGDQTQLPSLAVGSVAIPPNPSCVGTPSTTSTVYVGTGEENFGHSQVRHRRWQQLCVHHRQYPGPVQLPDESADREFGRAVRRRPRHRSAKRECHAGRGAGIQFHVAVGNLVLRRWRIELDARPPQRDARGGHRGRLR